MRGECRKAHGCVEGQAVISWPRAAVREEIQPVPN